MCRAYLKPFKKDITTIKYSSSVYNMPYCFQMTQKVFVHFDYSNCRPKVGLRFLKVIPHLSKRIMSQTDVSYIMFFCKVANYFNSE